MPPLSPKRPTTLLDQANEEEKRPFRRLWGIITSPLAVHYMTLFCFHRPRSIHRLCCPQVSPLSCVKVLFSTGYHLLCTPHLRVLGLRSIQAAGPAYVVLRS